MTNSQTSVYEALKARIMANELEPGTTLQEVVLAETFGVSRTPAREALRALVAEGLVVMRGRFYQVKSFSAEEAKRLYEVRESLECLACRLATERASEADLVELRAHLARHHSTVSAMTDGATSDGSVFHMRIAELSDNDVLYQTLRGIHDKVVVISRILDLRHRETYLSALDDHFRIVDAMLRRQAVIAEEEMRQHIRAGYELYRAYAIREIEEEQLILPRKSGRGQAAMRSMSAGDL